MSLSDIRNLDYVVLLCTRMEATRAFYRDVMRFPVEADGPTWASFRVGSMLLALRARGPAPAWQDGPGVEGSADLQLAFRVPPGAVETCHAELLAAGVPILRGPTELPAFRHMTLFFRDPEDNVIEIYAEI